MLNKALQADPKRTLFGFNNIFSACQHYFPSNEYTQYTSPTGLQWELHDYPEITSWKRQYFYEHPQTDSIQQNTVSEGTLSDADSVCPGEGSSVGDGRGPTSDISSATSLDALFGEEFEFSRYGGPTATTTNTLMLKPNQHRPKCLCLIGPSKLGKTLVARSFAEHSYFHGNWNIKQYNPNAQYNVFDDIKGQLDGFDFKSFLGAQKDIDITDKYHHKKRFHNGKPAIYISNTDPLTTRRGREHRDWLKANCTFVYVTTPLCNFAREALETEAIDDALQHLA
jgi:hypothetical protein